MSTVTPVIRRAIPIAAIVLSATEAQAHRRKSFAQEELRELADSIEQHGLINPVLVRPNPMRDPGEETSVFELVAGERRYLAAQLAGMEQIDATVRELTDEQVLEVQLIENLQREGLHPLHEAEGYEQLMKVHGHTADELGDKIGKSRRYVYSRIQLLKLCKEAREAFYGGRLTASTALLVARIPAAALQKEAIENIADERHADSPMSTREAARFIQDSYMLNLDDAPFPTIIENLVKSTPACHRCPKNTNSQPELFEDVKPTSAGVCTDLACFRKKEAAHIEDQVASATEKGQKVISGDAAKKIFPYGLHYAQGGYQLLEDVKDRVKEGAPTVLVRAREQYGDQREQLVEVVETKHVKAPARSKGSSSTPTKSKAQEKYEVEREAGKKFSNRLFKALFDKYSLSLRDAAELLVLDTLRSTGATHDVWEALGWNDFRSMDQVAKEVSKLSQTDLAKLMCVLPMWEDLDTYGSSTPAMMVAAAKSLKVDAAKIKKAIADEEKAAKAATPVTAKASKKKAPAKKK